MISIFEKNINIGLQMCGSLFSQMMFMDIFRSRSAIHFWKWFPSDSNLLALGNVYVIFPRVESRTPVTSNPACNKLNFSVNVGVTITMMYMCVTIYSYIIFHNLLIINVWWSLYGSVGHHRPHDDVINWKHIPRYWPFVRDFTGDRWIPRTKASDAELWCFLWSAPD